ncbi:MAG: hypothetical protein R3Y46_04190 [Opitutales bacterium]
MSEIATVKKILIRHPKEKLKKCSLSPLKGRADCDFYKAHPDFTYDASNCIVLEIDAPLISEKDAGKALVMLDSTWALLPKLRSKLTGNFIPRSLPANIQTAYPRISKIYQDPSKGLATIEALYAALRLSGQRDDTILDNYPFKDKFLEINDFNDE